MSISLWATEAQAHTAAEIAGEWVDENMADEVKLLALQALMVDFYWFDDGVYIVSVRPGLGALQGARVTAIGGVPIEEFQARLAPFVPRDNDMSARWLGAQLMQYTALVRATGATSTRRPAPQSPAASCGPSAAAPTRRTMRSG